MKRKVFILGLDGATLDLIEPWAGEGKLPTFRRLMKEGSWGRLRSMIRPITPVAWPSMMTGKNPGKHGMLDFCDLDHDDFQIPHYKCAMDVKAEFIWEILERKGIRCGIINIPLSSPFRSKISFGEGDHLRKDWMNFSWPEDTKAGLNSSNPLFEKRMLELIALRFDQIEHLIEEEWDFLAMNIFAVDPLQHFRWYKKDLLLEAFRKVDARLAEVLKKIEDTNLLLVSDHGMTTVKKNFYVNNWLHEKGYLKFKEEVRPSMAARMGVNRELFYRLINPVKRSLIKTGLLKFLPLRIKEMPRKLRRKISYKDGLEVEKLKDKIDWGETKAYCFGSYGSIFVNLKSRSKNGSVDEGDYKEVKDRLKSDLREYFDGFGWGYNIYEKEDIYSGPYLKDAPDLMIYVEEGGILPTSKYKLNCPDSAFDEPMKDIDATGHHSLDGIFLAYGPDIAGGKGIQNAEILDIAPTVLHIFGIPIPEDMDGKVLKEIFRDDSDISRREVIHQGVDEKGRIRERIMRMKGG